MISIKLLHSFILLIHQTLNLSLGEMEWPFLFQIFKYELNFSRTLLKHEMKILLKISCKISSTIRIDITVLTNVMKNLSIMLKYACTTNTQCIFFMIGSPYGAKC